MARKKRMNVYVAHHDGHYLRGFSVVVDETKEEALQQLNEKLSEQNLELATLDDLHELDPYAKQVQMLFNGDY